MVVPNQFFFLLSLAHETDTNTQSAPEENMSLPVPDVLSYRRRAAESVLCYCYSRFRRSPWPWPQTHNTPHQLQDLNEHTHWPISQSSLISVESKSQWKFSIRFSAAQLIHILYKAAVRLLESKEHFKCLQNLWTVQCFHRKRAYRYSKWDLFFLTPVIHKTISQSRQL